MTGTCWVPGADGSPFGVHHLPYGVFSSDSSGEEDPRVGVAIGPYVLDLAPLAASEWVEFASAFEAPSLNPFLAMGSEVWNAVRSWLTTRLTDDAYRSLVEPELVPMEQVTLHMPFEVADFVDFYASEYHATNLGRFFRPGDPPLLPNWKHLPIGYHGRAGTVSVSGTPVRRPHGQQARPDGPPAFGPSARLDVEAELGFVVGTPTRLGESVPVDAFEEHVFGVTLVNDWTARDIQGWEYRPLGPFLGKSFLTSVSPWITPLAALAHAQIPLPAQDPPPLPYLTGDGHGFDIDLVVRLNGIEISRPTYRSMYWSPAQMLAHLTVNGASVRTGDLFASGTISGATPDTYGSFVELSGGGKEPIRLSDGTTRVFLEDGDEVIISATAPGPDGTVIGLGEVAGRVTPATS